MELGTFVMQKKKKKKRKNRIGNKKEINQFFKILFNLLFFLQLKNYSINRSLFKIESDTLSIKRKKNKIEILLIE